MKISCIIPIYGLNVGDNAKFFADLMHAISVASAPLGEKFELIIVNDDKERISKQLITELCTRYGMGKKLVYMENETNKGQAYSRNVGALVSSGEYLHFIDQDDYISDDFYSEMLKSGNNAEIIISKPFFAKDDETRKAYTGLLYCL